MQRLLNKETGQPSGDILTGPVRLSWVSIMEPKEREGKTPKYEASLLFTPYVDPTIFYEEYNRLCAQSFSHYYDAATQQYYGLESPFHDQAAKARMKGYTPGLMYLNAKSNFKPSIVDIRGNPIVDPSKVYAGVWAICSINAYVFGINPPQPKKGISFGLQSVMILGDDTKIGKAEPTPRSRSLASKVESLHQSFALIFPTCSKASSNPYRASPVTQLPEVWLAHRVFRRGLNRKASVPRKLEVSMLAVRQRHQLRRRGSLFLLRRCNPLLKTMIQAG